MHTLTTTDTAELTAHLTRASKARREGVRLLRDRTDGRHYATSATTAGVVYYVTLVSCECPGFLHHGHCKHNSALIVAHALQEGHISPDPAPVAMECASCEGRGYWIKARQVARGEFIRSDEPCPTCHGDGLHIAA